MGNKEYKKESVAVAISALAVEILRKEKNKRLSKGVSMGIGAIASEAIVNYYKEN